MATIKAVRFQHFVRQLTKKEFKLFAFKMTKKLGRKFITDLLFNAFCKSSLNEKRIMNEDEMDVIIEIISNIIQSRKTNDESADIDIGLDTLNPNLIGVIASNLYQSDYMKLSRVNRSIYIGCNSPNTLQHLSLRRLHFPVCIDKFQWISSLDLDICSIEYIQSKQVQSMFNHLSNLQLFGEYEHKCLNMDSIGAFICLLQTHFLDLSNVEIFGLHWFGADDESELFDVDFFKEIMQRFKNIKYLKLDRVFLTDTLTNKEIKTMFSNLRKFSCGYQGSNIANTIVNVLGNALESLSIIHCAKYPLAKEVKLGNLQQLELHNITSDEVVMDIIDRVPLHNLKQLALYPSFRGISSECICKIICAQLLMEYVYIQTDSDCVCTVFDGLENGLFQTKNIKRKCLKIIVNIDCDKKIDLGRVILKATCVKQRLERCDISEFMQIIKFWDNERPNSRELIKATKHLRDIAIYDDNTVVMKSEGCKMIFCRKISLKI